MRLGTTELIVILLVVVIIFGPTQIPKLMKMFGKSIKGFRDGMAAADPDDEAPKTVKAEKADKVSADKVVKDAEQEAE